MYKTRIWMSAINPASYTVMNPNNARAHPMPQQRPPQMAHANYLRQQELLRSGLDRQSRSQELDEQMSMLNLNSPMSPMDQEQPLRNTSSAERLGSGSRGAGAYGDGRLSFQRYHRRSNFQQPSKVSSNHASTTERRVAWT